MRPICLSRPSREGTADRQGNCLNRTPAPLEILFEIVVRDLTRWAGQTLPVQKRVL